jgi:protein TonB
MFEQSILNGAPKTRRVWTVMVSFAGQIVVIGIAILIPLVAFDRMPLVHLTNPVMAPPPPPPGPGVSPREHSVQITQVIIEHTKGRIFEPGRIPPHVTKFVDPPELAPDVAAACVGCVPGGIGPRDGSGLGVLHSIGDAIRETTPPPPRDTKPVVRPVRQVAEKVKISEGVMMAKLIRQVKPVYPPMAIQTRTEGTVRLQAVISRDGIIQELQVVSGHPLLVQAAVNAVRQWVYQPTTLNGIPVEVLTTVDVNFKLSR